MTPQAIIEIVNDTARGEFMGNELLILQRYFLRMYCSWLPMRKISEMTYAKSHQSTYEAVQRVKGMEKYFEIREAITKELNFYLK